MQDFCTDIISTLEAQGYQVRKDKARPDFLIAKTTDEVQQHFIPATESHGRLNLKGLIMRLDPDGSLKLVAPGCNVPLDTQPEKGTVEVSGYSRAIDGIMYRFYYSDGWKFSTTGRVTPDTWWGPKGTPTFVELCQAAVEAGLVDYSKLNTNYCYYAILESPDFTNLVKHETLTLTLIDCVDCSTPMLIKVPLEQDTGFQSHDIVVDSQPDDNRPGPGYDTAGPVEQCDCGYNIHYKDGSIYHVSDLRFDEASAIRPNLADPVHQWISLMRNGGSDLVQKFLWYFPWNKELFDRLQAKFDALVVSVTDDYYRIREQGWRKVTVPARQVAYMKDLLYEIQDLPEDKKDVIRNHILQEDAKRIYYMINPHDIPPKTTRSELSV